MHQALWIEEITDEIVRHLNLRDLARVQGTCKALYYPAQNAAWRLQESLEALIGLLPSGLVVEGELYDLITWIGDSVQHYPVEQTITVPHKNRIRGQQLESSEPSEAGSNHAESDEDWPEEGPNDAALDLDFPAALNPDGSVVTERVEDDQHILIFQRLPCEDDIRELIRRSRRCPRIRYDHRDHKAYLVLEALMRMFPDIAFFPVLKELIITNPQKPLPIPERSNGLAIPFILMPSFTTFTIEDVCQSDRVLDMYRTSMRRLFDSLDSLPTGSMNNLRSLVYATTIREYDLAEGYIPYVSIPHQICRFTESTPSLRYLRLPVAPDRSEWTALTQTPALEELELGQSRGGADLRGSRNGWDREDPVLREFPSLRTLTCRRHGCSTDLAHALSTYSFPSLEAVEITDPESEAQAVSIIEKLKWSTLPFPSFTRLHIDIGSPRVRAPDIVPQILSSMNIRDILSRCSRLEYLHLRFPASIDFSINNNDISYVATALPLITHLFLDPVHSSRSKVTLEGLLPLVRKCPQLQYLGIGLDPNCTHIVYASAMYLMEQGNAKPSEISYLDLGAPWVHDTSTCAEFLRCIFPNIKEIALPTADQYDPSSGRMFAWSKVVQLVKELGTIGAAAREPTQAAPNFDEDDDDYFYDSGAEDEDDYPDNSD